MAMNSAKYKPASNVAQARPWDEITRQPSGRMVPCDGEAHSSGGMADHCGVCAPRWGEVPELLPLDLERARTRGGDVPLGQLTDEQYAQVAADMKAGKCRSLDVEHRTRGAKRFYSVARYPHPPAYLVLTVEYPAGVLCDGTGLYERAVVHGSTAPGKRLDLGLEAEALGRARWEQLKRLGVIPVCGGDEA